MRKMLSYVSTHPNIKNEVGKYKSDVVQEVAKTIAENRVVVVGMKYNPLVNRASELLKKSGIDFTYLEYGSYTS